MSFDQFKAKPMQRFTSSMWNSLMDVLNQLEATNRDELIKRVKYEDLGSLAYSIVPDQDGARDLGSSDRSWNSIYAGTGHFSNNVYVQGKQVIKDGDPVEIGDIHDAARDKISQAIDGASFNKLLQDMLSKLDVDLGTRASESTLQSVLSRLDTDLSTRASESTLSNIHTLLTTLLTSSGNARVALVETTIKQPIDVQDHLSESVTVLASGARTSSGSGSDVDVARFAFGDFCVDVTAVSGTSPTLSVYVEGRIRAVGKYRVLCSFENITATGTFCCTVDPLSYALVRARWVIGGTSPSFTFAVVGELKS